MKIGSPAIAPMTTDPWCRALVVASILLTIVIGTYASLWSLHFSSDHAMIGLMARHVLRGEYPIFIWRQGYMGTLEVYLSALVFRYVGESPRTLNLVPIGFYLLFIALFTAAARRYYPPRIAGLAVVLLVLAPATFYSRIVRPQPNYVETLVFGLLVMVLVERWRDRPRDRTIILLGLVLGLACWTFMLILPFLAALGLHAVLGRAARAAAGGGRTWRDWFERFALPGRCDPPRDRITPGGFRGPHRTASAPQQGPGSTSAVRTLHRTRVLAHAPEPCSGIVRCTRRQRRAVWVGLGLVAAAAGFWLTTNHSRLGRLAMWLALLPGGGLIALAHGWPCRGLLVRKAVLRRSMLFGLVFTVTFAPALFYRLTQGGRVRYSYTLATPAVAWRNLRNYSRSAAPALLGLDRLPPWSHLPVEAIFLAGLLVLALDYLRRVYRQAAGDHSRRPFPLAPLMVVIPILVLLSSLPYDGGSSRYLIPLWCEFPLGLAVMADGIARRGAWGRRLGMAMLALVEITLIVGHGRDIRAEYLVHRDHHVKLAHWLEAQGVRGGYADYWDAYVVNFLTAERVILAPRLPNYFKDRLAEVPGYYPPYWSYVQNLPVVAILPERRFPDRDPNIFRRGSEQYRAIGRYVVDGTPIILARHIAAAPSSEPPAAFVSQGIW